MLDFETFIARHNEQVAQALIEGLELHQGMRIRTGMCLEQRWNDVMRDDVRAPQALAA